MYIYVYTFTYMKYVYVLYIHLIYIGGLGELVRLVRPPRNREIGFVSSSFSFRACRACRACGRGEAAWACMCRSLSLSLGLLGARIHVCAALGVDLLCAGAWALTVFIGVLCFRGFRRRSFVRRHMGFNTNCCFSLSFEDMLMQIAWVLRS